MDTVVPRPPLQQTGPGFAGGLIIQGHLPCHVLGLSKWPANIAEVPDKTETTFHSHHFWHNVMWSTNDKTKRY